jgi:hypothetical protein
MFLSVPRLHAVGYKEGNQGTIQRVTEEEAPFQNKLISWKEQKYGHESRVGPDWRRAAQNTDLLCSLLCSALYRYLIGWTEENDEKLQ